MQRLSILVCVLSILGGVVTAEAASREQTLKAWGAHVGTWEMIGPNGQSGEVSIRKSQSGACYIHESPEATYVAGWDEGKGKLKVVGFRRDGGSSVSYWELVGDAPKFEGETEDGTKLVIVFTAKDRSELRAGDTKYVFERK